MGPIRDGMETAVDETQITQLVSAAVHEVNRQLRKAERLERSPATILSGEGSCLDSLGLVNLIVAIEQQIERRYGVAITLAEEGALSEEQGPFHTLGSLTEHVHAVLKRKLRG